MLFHSSARGARLQVFFVVKIGFWNLSYCFPQISNCKFSHRHYCPSIAFYFKPRFCPNYFTLHFYKFREGLKEILEIIIINVHVHFISSNAVIICKYICKKLRQNKITEMKVATHDFVNVTFKDHKIDLGIKIYLVIYLQSIWKSYASDDIFLP